MRYYRIILASILTTIIILASGCGKKEVEDAPAVSDTAEEMEVIEEPEKQEEELAEPEEIEESSEPETEIVDNEISDNWMDGEFLLEGIKLKMPCSFEDVAKTGWVLERSDSEYAVVYMDENDNIYEDYSISYMVPAKCGFDYIYLENKRYEDGAIQISLHNPAERELDVEECPIRGFYEFRKSPVQREQSPVVGEIVLPKGITYGSTVDEVIAAYGEPSYTNSDSNFSWMTYSNEETYFRMELSFSGDFGLYTISLFWDEWN